MEEVIDNEDTDSSSPDDSQELLERFRMAWRIELRKQHEQSKNGNPGVQESTEASSIPKQDVEMVHPEEPVILPLRVKGKKYDENYCIIKGYKSCEPEASVKDYELHLSSMPEEVILYLFSFFDPISIIHLSIVCKHFYFMAQEPIIWRSTCLGIWKNDCKLSDLEYYHTWKRMYLLRPRLRFDGCYVSNCSYIRAGATENKYYQPVHAVNYYRFLRFFDNGTVICTTSLENPKAVLKWFSPSFSASDDHPARHVRVGFYTFDTTTGIMMVSVKDSRRGFSSVRFNFVLRLVTQSAGLFSKMVVKEYSSTNELTMEVDILSKSISHMKSFHFQKLPKRFLATERKFIDNFGTNTF